MPSIVCPTCEHRIKVAENAGGKRVMCSKCGEIIPVPKSVVFGEGDAPAVRVSAADRARALREEARLTLGALREPRNLGLTLVGLGLVSILLICLQEFGFYTGLVLSGGGLLIGLVATARCLLRHGRGVLYLLGGCGACLLALLLILGPFLWQ